MRTWEIVYREFGKNRNASGEQVDLAIRCIRFKDLCMDALNGVTLQDRKDLLKAAFKYMMFDEYPEYYEDYLEEFIKEVEKDEKHY